MTNSKLASQSSNPDPTTDERTAITSARTRVAARQPRLTTRLETDDSGGVASVGPEHADHDGWIVRLQDLFGTHGKQFPLTQLNHVLAVARSADGKYDKTKVNALLAAIEGAQPSELVPANRTMS